MSTAPPAHRRAWTLQARLMTAVIAVVALILTLVGVGTSAILSRILQDTLDTQLSAAAREVPVLPDLSATQILEARRDREGTLLLMHSPQGGSTAARVTGDDSIQALSADQINDIHVGASTGEAALTVDITGLGDYRVHVYSALGRVVVLGLPMSEISTTIAQILTTVALVTAGGLFLLASIIAIVIRAGLKPLRAVADTATRVASVRMDQGEVSITERVPPEETDDRTEIGQVGAALNRLLDHVDTSLTARQRNEELMRRFVADASHELRTPLASIRGYSELSLRALRARESPGPSDERGEEVITQTESALERIQAQSLRMSALVEDLLLLARLDEGQELVYGSVDLTQLAVEAIADARPAGPDHVWVLDVGDEPVLLAGDAPRLHQVVANLLANARTHTPSGTTVTLSVAHVGDQAVLRVHDDGPGIDPAITERLFERFSRADRSRARQTGGTGLGLSIARAIVQAHGGTISVRSVAGDTTFEVRLPAKPADPAD